MMSQWSPSEGIEDTYELMDIITSDDSLAVLAGAGTGKTELLAQKANYLFFTDKCAWPKRVLSLTFKTEAQQNIKERVNKRCGQKANRFDSFTFHAFCKSIVDRFKNVLPEPDRPQNNYDIVFRSQDANGVDKILMGNLLGLAISILKARDDIREIFSYSYEYVFVDEFQDTTDQQYELLQILFQNTETTVLTVGDINQSIMMWAGAKKGVFNDFLSDFSATSKFLVKNYRASKEIQDVLEIVLQYVQDPSQSISEIVTEPTQCFLHVFSDEEQEALFVVKSIEEAISKGVSGGDICILTKQQSSQYTEVLRAELTKSGINSLDMNDLQDALKEELGQLFSLFLKAMICPTAKIMTDIYGINLALNEVEAGHRKEDELTTSLSKFISEKRDLLTANTTPEDLLSYIQSFIHFLGVEKVKGRWKQYRSPEYYHSIWRVLADHLQNMCSQSMSLEDASKLFSAENSVQIMNVHKCKGLEYKLVYFLGLEDQAFWSYAKEPFENNCAIYVAMSRAKEQLVVTYTKRREHRVNQWHDNRQSSCSVIKGVIKVLLDKCKFDFTNHTL